MLASKFSIIAAGTPRIHGKVLVVLFGYGLPTCNVAKPVGFAAKCLDQVFSLYVRYRDFYLAPRPQGVMLGYLERALAQGRPSSVDITGCGAPQPDKYSLDDAFARRDIDWRTELPDFQGYDTLLLVYPDPLGMGWSKLESRLMGAGCQNLVVLNGRSRLFNLTRDVHRLLRGRRTLALTRWPDLLCGLLIPPLAAILAVKDVFTGKKA